MEQQYNSNAGQSLGIAGLIVGIVGLFMALLPCTAIFAIILAIVGITLSAIGLAKANKAMAPKGMLIAALIVSILGFLVAGIWGVVITRVASDPGWKKAFQFYDKAIEDLDSMKTLENLDSTLILEPDSINDETMKKLEKDMDNLNKNKLPIQPVTPISPNKNDIKKKKNN